MNPMILKRIEIGLKAGVLEYFNIFEKKRFLPTGPYFQLVLDKDNDWYFDTSNDPEIKDREKEWSIGFAEGSVRYFDLYSYNPYGDIRTFTDSNWNIEELSMLIEYVKGNNKLDALLNSIRKFDLSFRDTEYGLDAKAQSKLGRFWKWTD